jgi:hypothetical protein
VSVVDDDLNKIHEVIALYQKAHYHADTDALERAFHPEAQITGHYKGKSAVTRRGDYKDVLLRGKSAAACGEASYTRILMIDRTATTALVKVQSLMRGDVFISMLTLWKVTTGNWQIISGVFHLDS